MKKNTDKDIIVGIHAVRILLKIRPFDVYEIYSSDLKDNEAERFISLALTKYCSVGSSIRKDTKVNHSFKIIRD